MFLLVFGTYIDRGLYKSTQLHFNCAQILSKDLNRALMFDRNLGRGVIVIFTNSRRKLCQ